MLKKDLRIREMSSAYRPRAGAVCVVLLLPRREGVVGVYVAAQAMPVQALFSRAAPTHTTDMAARV